MTRDQHKLSVQQREEMKDLYIGGTPVRRLSEKFYLSIACVIKNLNGMGVKTNGKRLEKTEDYKFNEMSSKQ